MKQRPAIDHQQHRREGALIPSWLVVIDLSNTDNLNGDRGGWVCAYARMRECVRVFVFSCVYACVCACVHACVRYMFTIYDYNI